MDFVLAALVAILSFPRFFKHGQAWGILQKRRFQHSMIPGPIDDVAKDILGL